MAGTLRLAWEICRHMGPGWLAWRIGYAARRYLGLLERRMPARPWSEYPLPALLREPARSETEYLQLRRGSPPRFLFSLRDRSRYGELFCDWDRAAASPVLEADDVLRGRFRLFGHMMRDAGFPPDWHSNQLTGESVRADVHWSRIGEFERGDIKGVWELSRFGFAFPLVRAYWRTGDDRYAEGFWHLVRDWRERNPPNLGANWMCGQEVSLRMIAWCFALYGFRESTATTPGRLARLVEMIAVSTGRIEANVGYALSQRNNHGVSEAAGLWTAGVLFPELRRAGRWRRLGRRLLERLARQLIYEDGSFSQHSVNYHRLMLHCFLWAVRLGDVNAQPLSPVLKGRVAKAGRWLFDMQDEDSGRAPMYGADDGAMLLPLANCDRRDLRPTTAAAGFLPDRELVHAPGPWDEAVFWLFGPEALAAKRSQPRRAEMSAGAGGYYTLRSRMGMAFVRSPRFRHRPSHADLLHMDLWWRGHNVAIDPGTFGYNAPPPWDSIPLSRTEFHNTVTVDGEDQMARAGRFLWLPWARGKVTARRASQRGFFAYWEGEHDGYARLRPAALHRRGILRMGDEHWLVVDSVACRSGREVRIHWLLPDVPCEWDERTGLLALRFGAGEYHVCAGGPDGLTRTLVRADCASPRGWRAPRYACREPALSYAVAARTGSAVFWTLFGTADSERSFEDGSMLVSTPQWRARVELARVCGSHALVQEASCTGAVDDELEPA